MKGLLPVLFPVLCIGAMLGGCELYRASFPPAHHGVMLGTIKVTKFYLGLGISLAGVAGLIYSFVWMGRKGNALDR